MAEEKRAFIQVYCPELQEMIRPGEWAMCPYFTGSELDYTDTEDALKQIFRCHVQCGCEIQYQYYRGSELVTCSASVIEDPETLRLILGLVAKSGKPHTQPQTATILLADDDPDFLEMHTAVLKARGYLVTGASSAKEALSLLAELTPDLVILDVMMEHFDSGFTACKKIKSINPNLPVMLLTSIGAQTGLEFSSNDEVLTLTGADKILDKPVSPKLFLDTVEALIGITG
jgi:CheY-like chemotaxis protein